MNEQIVTSGPVNVSRRAVLLGLAAGTFVIGTGLNPLRALAQEQKFAGEGMPGGIARDPRVFVAIAENGETTVICQRAEMGQGIRTSWAMVIADELEAAWDQVKVVQAPGDEQRYGNQNTDGSRSMRHHFAALRQIGAAVRAMLHEEAASRWGVPVAEVSSEQHRVTHVASGRSLGYGDLAASAASRAVPDLASIVLKSPDQFRYIGKSDRLIVDGFDITVGRALYGIDAKVEGMLHAAIARPPVWGGKLRSHDATEALKVPGVVRVVVLDQPDAPAALLPVGGVAVIAENTFAARKGREALVLQWDDGANAVYTSADYRKALEAAAQQRGAVVRSSGNVDQALAGASKRVVGEYYMPHLAQAPLEPPTATARVTADGCEVWTSVQAPEQARGDIAKTLGLPIEKVTINCLLLGGGFGRKAKPDFAVEAAMLSRAMDGRPVKVTFSREDDLSHGFLHTVSLERLEASITVEGKVDGWLHKTVAPTIIATFAAGAKNEAPFELAMGAVDMPFDIPNVRVENPEATAHTRLGWFRAVSNLPHAFAIQSFADELAHALGRDPKDFLLELIGPDRKIDPAVVGDKFLYTEDPAIYAWNTARLKRVIERVAVESSWGSSLPEGHGRGIAAHWSFASYAAAVVEVAIKDGQMTIPRVDIALDCGQAVNPERVRAQLEGAVIQGVGLATIGEITFTNGRIDQSNFDGYELLRIDAAPKAIVTHLVEPNDLAAPIGGVGEPGLPPVAPALCNAIFAATGKRIRSLPIRDQFA